MVLVSMMLISCTSRSERWVVAPYSTADIKNVIVTANVGEETAKLFLCSKSRSVGEIQLNNSTRYFCVSKGMEQKFATLKKSESGIELCLWKESGFCTDGVCESASYPSDCKIF